MKARFSFLLLASLPLLGCEVRGTATTNRPYYSSPPPPAYVPPPPADPECADVAHGRYVLKYDAGTYPPGYLYVTASYGSYDPYSASVVFGEFSTPYGCVATSPSQTWLSCDLGLWPDGYVEYAIDTANSYGDAYYDISNLAWSTYYGTHVICHGPYVFERLDPWTPNGLGRLSSDPYNNALILGPAD